MSLRGILSVGSWQSGSPRAEFIVADHEPLLITSANFSYSAANRNVEFGILVRDAVFATSIETSMTGEHGSLYEPATQTARHHP